MTSIDESIKLLGEEWGLESKNETRMREWGDVNVPTAYTSTILYIYIFGKIYFYISTQQTKNRVVIVHRDR